MIDNRLNQKAALYENTASLPRVEIRLRGHAPNTQAIGAKLTLTGRSVPQYRQVISGGGYESGSVPDEMFAANGAGSFYHLTVRWPDGTKTRIDSIKANRIYEIDEPRSGNVTVQSPQMNNKKRQSNTIFEDVSSRISYTHHEDVYPDFKIQALLPERLSKEGPGVAWIDYNRDGNEDLFVASGKEWRLQI